MSDRVMNALHDVHTANNDVLKGYLELSARAEPEIKGVIGRLTDLHQRHASELAAELVRMRETTQDDTSLQGTLNKAVVIMRDWVSDLDRDVLPNVRAGEESLRDGYYKALRDVEVAANPMVSAMLNTHIEAITVEISKLPKD